MPAAETLNEVKKIMSEVFYVDDLDVTESTTADDVAEWDSLSHIRLIVAIERKFKIKFKNSEIESLKNVGDLVKMIEAKVS